MADNFNSQINAIQKALSVFQKPLTPLLRYLAVKLLSDVKLESYNKERGPDNKPWPETIKKQRLGSDAQMLVQNGILKRSIREDVQGNNIILGTNVEYAQMHQFGYTNKNIPEHTKIINQAFGKPIAPKKITVKSHTRTLPAREFLGFHKRQFALIQETIESQIAKQAPGDINVN